MEINSYDIAFVVCINQRPEGISLVSHRSALIPLANKGIIWQIHKVKIWLKKCWVLIEKPREGDDC